MKKQRLSLQRKRALSGWVFITPFLIGFLYFFLVPLIKSVIYSFSSIKMSSNGFQLTWVGLRNYKRTFAEDPDNLRMILTSIGNVLVTVIVVVIFSLIVALILNQKFPGNSAMRAIFALPIIISSGVIIVLLKENVLQQNMGADTVETIFQSNGVLNYLRQVGLPDNIVNFFESVINNIFDMVWRSGMQIILFLSALQSISPSSYEAALIEGATPWESFWFVTFPMISPFLLVNTIYTVIDTFTDSTNVVMQKILSFITGIEYESALSLGMAYFLLVLAVVGIVYGVMNRYIRDK